MPTVIHTKPVAHNPGHVRILTDEPVGDKQGGGVMLVHDVDQTPEPVVVPPLRIPDGCDETTRRNLESAHAAEELRARVNPFTNVRQTIHAHGQTEFEILDGCAVRFPDGTTWQPKKAAAKA